jgi:cellulose synthase/poly-beta-1,6-N-acetylglucosamine synthase-like glycosyltransferase
MNRAEAAVLTIYYLTLGVLVFLALHRFYLVRLRRRHQAPERVRGEVLLPVTVQLPLYNEPLVAARLIDAAARMRHLGPLEIQVLDDSNDETTVIVAERVAVWREAGVDVKHVRRTSRDGYKAGALAYGATLASGSLFAVFDADFVPPVDFLEKVTPFFANPRVGMVQARWGHLNREESLLTRVQAIYLDAHFAVESAARNFSGRFFNFNGTAGVWRREAIADAGGWSADTLTEDLDLSYRAQMAGWEFVFVDDFEVPAELPGSVAAFQQQQQRWAGGSIQTARKLLPSIMTGDLAWRVRIEAFFHLTNNVAYLLSFLLALLVVPAALIRHRYGLSPLLALDLVFFAVSTSSVFLFYLEGQRRAGRPVPLVREMLAVLPIGLGISLRNAAAVLRGFVVNGGEFRRTPKRGISALRLPRMHVTAPWLEASMTIFFIAAAGLFAEAKIWAAIPIAMLFMSGYGYVTALRVSERLRHAKTIL